MFVFEIEVYTVLQKVSKIVFSDVLSDSVLFSGGSVWSDKLSKPMQRKLISLLCYQLMEYKGFQRALKTARAIAERALSELIIYHQDNSNISATLWSAIRSRGCQFLGPGN